MHRPLCSFPAVSAYDTVTRLIILFNIVEILASRNSAVNRLCCRMPDVEKRLHNKKVTGAARKQSKFFQSSKNGDVETTACCVSKQYGT